MKRKAAPGSASEQPANKLSSSKGKQVAGSPVDTDQKAHAVLCATAPSQKAMTPQPGSFGQHLLKGFASLWNDRSQLADVILSVRDQQVPAHSCVLCMWSEVFKALLTRWSAQRTDNGLKAAVVTVDLSQGDSPEDFLELLHYCYVGTCQLDSHNVLPLLRLSNYYEILPLKDTCGRFLFDLLTARNCLNLLLELTEKYVCTRARRMLIQHMAQNFEGLLEEGALWRLPCRVWQEILLQDCLAVANESAVLTAVWRYDTYVGHAQPQESNTAMTTAIDFAINGMRDSVMERLLPCVRLPQLGLTTLLDRVEQNTWLMSLDVTKDYLANAFRCLLLSKEGQAAKPLAVAGSCSAAGSSSLGDSNSEIFEARMREVTMGLQGRPRRPPPSFTNPSEGHNLGFLLERGRCTATTQAEGGLKTALWEMGGSQQHVLLVSLASNAPRSCYTVVQPGLQSGSMYIELLIQSTRPSSSGTRGLKFWVVRNPRLEPQPDHPDGRPLWDSYGILYGRMAAAAANGQDGRVQRVAVRSLPSNGAALQPPTTCEGFSQGDIIGVGVRTIGLSDSHMLPECLQYKKEEQLVVTFHKNGRLMAKHKLPPSRPDHSDIRSSKAVKNDQWHVMVSSGTPGDSVQLLRLAPTQAAKPSSFRVSETVLPAAQLDAKSQGKRRAAALKELMIAPVPHPHHGGDPIPMGRLMGLLEEALERRARLHGIHPEGDEMMGPPGLAGQQLQGMDHPDGTDEEEEHYFDEDSDEDMSADEVDPEADDERHAMHIARLSARLIARGY